MNLIPFCSIILGFCVVTLLEASCGHESVQKSSHSHDHEHGDHHESTLQNKLRYLPEFNVPSDKYSKWKSYYDIIQLANIEFYENQISAKQNSRDEDEEASPFLSLVESDLLAFIDLFGRENFLTKEIVDAMVESKQAVHYQIVDGKLYRDSQCLFPSRCEGVEHFLLKLVSKLPNMDLFINVRDYPQVPSFYPENKKYPIFSFSKDTSSYMDLTYPAWTFWSGGPALDIYPRGIGRWDLMRQSLLQAATKWPWHAKEDKAFFRGSRTSNARDPIVLLSRSRPDLVDAKYTKNQAWKSKADTLGEDPASTVSFEDHCQYRYLFNAHGVAASFRLKHLFLCGSLVLNVQSDWIEFFYPPLKPWIHYVPLSSKLNDTVEVLGFLQDNPEIAQHIANRGFTFIRDRLTMNAVLDYWHHLLLEYSSKVVHYRPTEPSARLVEIADKGQP